MHNEFIDYQVHDVMAMYALSCARPGSPLMANFRLDRAHVRVNYCMGTLRDVSFLAGFVGPLHIAPSSPPTPSTGFPFHTLHPKGNYNPNNRNTYEEEGV